MWTQTSKALDLMKTKQKEKGVMASWHCHWALDGSAQYSQAVDMTALPDLSAVAAMRSRAHVTPFSRIEGGSEVQKGCVQRPVSFTSHKVKKVISFVIL